MTNYDVISGQDFQLSSPITSTQTSNIGIAPKTVNNSQWVWEATEGVILITETVGGSLKVEWINFTGGSLDSDNNFILTGVERDVPVDSSGRTGNGTGQDFSKGARVQLVVHHSLLNNKADVDVANTFSAAQTLGDDVKLYLGAGTEAYVVGKSDNKIYFADTENGESDLSTALASGNDEKVGISSNDTTPAYLVNKVTGGDGVTVTETNDGSNETLDIGVDLATDKGLEFSSGQLQIKASTGITLDSNGISVNPSSISGDMETIGSVTTASSNVGASSTSETTMAPTWTGSNQIDANTLADGDVIHLKIGGNYELASDTLDIRIKMGGTILARFRISTASADLAWDIHASIYVRSAGASGSLLCSGSCSGGIYDVSTALASGSTVASSAVAIDTTANQAITATAQFYNSSANHYCNVQVGSITLQHA